MDREKVSKGLEICSEYGSWHGLDCEHNEAYKDCPYRGCETGCIVTIAKDALTLLKEQESTINELQNAYGYLQKEFFEAQDKLLKEQEALKPKNKSRHGSTTMYQHFCGNCMAMLHGKPKYCPNCGRQVKWK